MQAQKRDDLFTLLRSQKLLLVEDDELIRDSLALFFAYEGCALEVRENAEEGVLILREQNFDVVITDFRLPGMNGLEFLRILQEIQPAAHKILLTAYMTEDVLAEAFRLGVHEFIEKPFSPADIEDALARVVRQRKVVPPAAGHYGGRH